MKNTSKSELADLVGGYRILDAKCAAVDEGAANELCNERPARFPRAASAAPFLASTASDQGQCVLRNHPVPIRVVHGLPTQPWPCHRRRRASWLKAIMRAERVPLMLALTGVATSAFLAMLFSMFERRTSAALGIYDRGNVARSFNVTREGHTAAPVSAPSGLMSAIWALKPLIVSFPAVMGLGIFGVAWLRRTMRTRRRARRRSHSARNPALGEGPLLQQTRSAATPARKIPEPRQRQSSVLPDEEQIRRAA